MKKILIVVESLDINDSSATKGRISLINNLVDSGIELRVCHYTRKDIDFNLINVDNSECISIPERKYNLIYLLSRSLRVFYRLTNINLSIFFEKWLGFSFTFFNDTKSISQEIKKQLDFNPDLILTLSKGASFRPHYALLKMPELHDKWMAYIHDPYPYHFYPRPYNWVEPGYKHKENFFKEVSEKAKYSVFPSFLLKEWMGSYFPDFLRTGIVIPHQLHKVKSFEKPLPDYFDASKFTLLHAGNLMKTRSPLALLEGYKLFLERTSGAKLRCQLLLLGRASYFEEEFKEYVLEIPSLVIKNENVSFSEVLHMQYKASVNIILESKSEISPFLPGKFPHCVAANKPILLLSPYYSETKRLLGNEYPYVSEADDIKKIASILGILYDLWQKNPEILRLNRKDLEIYLSSDYLKKIINKDCLKDAI